MRIAEARARVALVRQALAKHPDVNAVGVGEKMSGGRSAKSYAAIVFVERKGRPMGSVLPRMLQTKRGPMPLDVVEAGTKAFEVVNSVLDGADILIDGTNRRQGTLAFVSRSAKGVFGITNAHVVTGPGGNAVGLSVLTLLNGQRTHIGTVVGHSPYDPGITNQHDVALIRLDPGAETIAAPFMTEAFPDQRIGQLGVLSPTPQGASRRVYTYASRVRGGLEKTQLSHVTELSGITAIDSDGTALPFGRVYHLTAIAGQVAKGHSGAALVRQTTSGHLLAVGLLFAGSGANAFALSWADLAAPLKSFGA